MISSRLASLGRALSRSRFLFAAAILAIVGSCRDVTGPTLIPADASHPMFALTASAQTVQAGAFVTLTFDFNGNKTPVWTSSDTTVATVVPQALHTARVYGKRPGTVTITATAGPTVGSTVVTVVPAAVSSVTLAPDSAIVERLDTMQFVATARDVNGNVLTGRTTTWRSTDTTVASVSSTGRAAARARGSASVIATAEGRADTARFVVRQAQLTVSSIGAPDSTWSGDGFLLRYSVQNLWDSPAADSVIVRIGYRDSAGTVIDAQRRALPRVAGGATVQDSTVMAVSGAPGGAVSVVVYVDCRDGVGGTDTSYLAACLASPASAGSIGEGDETDNSRAATVRVRLPNLMINAISPSPAPDTVYTRRTATRRYRVHNQGSAAGSGFEYIVGLRDMTTQSFVTAVGQTYSGLLGTRQTDTVAVTMNVPAIDPSHVYQFYAATDCPAQGNPASRLQACFDQPGSGSAVAELDELDNRDVYSPFVVVSSLARIVAPDSILLSAIGDTVRLAPIAYDLAGAPLTDAVVTFESLDPAIVSATAGLVTARAAGVGRVVSRSEGRADTSRVSVVQTPAAVVSSPATITMLSLGDTAAVTAVVQDRNGNSISGATVTWMSLTPSVASIVAPGKAVAHANGAAGIVATALDGHADTSWVSVAQRVARIDAAPDSSWLANRRDTTRLSATAFDARGNVVVPSVSISWTALDPAAVTVDSLGLATGVAAQVSGRVVARAGLVADTVRVTVGGIPGPVLPVPSTLWKPTVGAVPADRNYVYLQSDAGDYIGGGKTSTYTQANAVITAAVSGGRFTTAVGGWNGTFQAMTGVSPLEAGYYGNLTRYPFHDPVKGGLDWSGNGRGCNTLTGWFAVDSITYTAGVLTQIDVRFEQHCEGGTPALHGAIHWRSDDPTAPPGPVLPIPAGLWTPASGATPTDGNYVHLQSDAGDYIGGGQTSTITPAVTPISVTASGAHLSVTTAGWYGDFQGMNVVSTLQPGYYGDLSRYPFHNPTKGGLSWSGNGRGCNTLTGWFAVDSVTYVGPTLTQIDLRFEQHCEGGTPALHGAIHWRAPDPSAPAGP